MSFTKSNSPFISLIRIKQQFGDSGLNAADIVNKVMSGSFTGHLQQAIGVSGKLYDISKSDGVITCDIYRQVDNTLSKIQQINTDENLLDVVLQDIQPETIVEGVEGVSSLAEVIQDISDGGRFNTAVSELSNLFLYSNKVAISDISSTLLANNAMATNDVNYLINLFGQNAVDGKVDTYTCLGLINSIATSSKSEVDDGALELDTTQPFIIQGFIATVAAFGSFILSTVLGVLSSALGGILSVIGGFVTSIINVVANNTSDVLLLDDNTSTGYVDGPVQYSTDWSNVISGQAWGLNLDLTNNLCCINKFGPIDQFIWKNGSDYLVNSFMHLNFDFERFSESVIPTINNAGEGPVEYSRYITVPNWDRYVAESVHDDFEYHFKTIADPSYATKRLALECIVIGAMGAYPMWKDGNRYKDSQMVVYLPNLVKTNRELFTQISSSSTFLNFRINCHVYIRNVLYRHKYIHAASCSENDWIDETGMSDGEAMAVIQKFYTLFVPACATLGCSETSTDLYTKFATHTSAITDITWTNNPFLSTKRIDVQYSTGPDDERQLYTYQEWSYADTIPSTRTWQIPSISSTGAYKVLAIVGVIAATASIGLTMGARVLKKKKFVRQMKEKDKLAKARKAYYDNPSTENLNSFYKAQKSYNFKAKLWGWSTYDATNDWFNDCSGATTTAAGTTNSVTDNVLYHLIKGNN